MKRERGRGIVQGYPNIGRHGAIIFQRDTGERVKLTGVPYDVTSYLDAIPKEMKGMKHKESVILYALTLVEKGFGTSHVARILSSKYEDSIHYSTIYRWVKKYRPDIKLSRLGRKRTPELQLNISRGITAWHIHKGHKLKPKTK